MIQEVVTQYDTIYETNQGTNNLVITVQPQSITPNTLEAELILDSGKEIINNVTVLEGELSMILKNTLRDIDFEIDDDGNLIVHGLDANNYSIDAEGFLIYTYR